MRCLSPWTKHDYRWFSHDRHLVLLVGRALGLVCTHMCVCLSLSCPLQETRLISLFGVSGIIVFQCILLRAWPWGRVSYALL
ncbi:hypothetical protein F5B18DRAFT_222408 [Nemania serpens]|nr:hypothetical protein F5B18DRAFT_222408 [Nemania serpens]